MRGQDFHELHPVAAINVLDYNYLPGNHVHTRYSLYSTDTRSDLDGTFELHFLELRKFHLERTIKGESLREWVTCLNRAYAEEGVRMENPMVRKAMDRLEALSRDPEARALYDQRLRELAGAILQMSELPGGKAGKRG